jgi:ligand-binding sensor domain-containing protein
MSTNLAATTKLKVSQLYPQSFVRLIDRRNMFFIGHKTGIQLYDIGTGKID